MRKFLLLNVLILSSISVFSQAKPNVVILYVDDLGYGDLSCYGNKQVATPNADWLARNGLKMTNAHCSASTCTPSRYALLTGRYAWRQKGTNILPGNANLIVPTDMKTLPKVFKQAGYATAVVGKWHLGMGDSFPINWNLKVSPGTKDVGFDYSFIFPATADRVPNIFMENDSAVGLDAQDPISVDYVNAFEDELRGDKNNALLKLKTSPNQGHLGHINNNISRIGFMKGGRMAEWTDEELGATFSQKAVQFIERSAKQPFFLYFAIHDIHVPRMPATQYKGKSKLGLRGDALLEMDAMIGDIIKTLKNNNLLENTILILSSDNGPVLDDGYMDLAKERASSTGFDPRGGTYRGGKYSVLEAGTRVPLLVYWKGHIQPNGVSDALFSQVNLKASLENMLQQQPAAEFTDSHNQWPVLQGKAAVNDTYIIEEGTNGCLAIVQNQWKYITPNAGKPYQETVDIEMGFSPDEQLYNLTSDPSEKHNLASQEPAKLKKLKALLQTEMARK